MSREKMGQIVGRDYGTDLNRHSCTHEASSPKRQSC
jgi:hypothetical protein